ncbi:hypothetical protein CLAFUW4_03988 [Fulvia fulva]|uniref:Uncharacterized protein n=1 Tax=Passalora fulva TaxID=5499 RepID=A0A9Q8P7W5_PASFU|nr:uncharacterized protein CLAFUR5_03953 [Fulvia fulva]KAK4627045.1 hypothetical protein CLAFUR4_03974 [Fulvia fulva]KAK4627983.1 hypothetical protein CLAFUR0_03975 [Fulvia fulva]UJO16307.1 hypothetical protein CLAFUR5_03953 [Fulvia fulva]WPV13797.1 hypothetical protein CLAFUW4_03988 [Fulvia fulva]WPV29023.1 hypothetical protein CLAFUW7_03977 [Fulvia fulva]
MLGLRMGAVQWDDPPDFKPGAASKAAREEEVEGVDFGPARGVVQWDEPAGPDDGKPATSSNFYKNIRPANIQTAARLNSPSQEEMARGAGLAQWDDAPDSKPAATQKRQGQPGRTEETGSEGLVASKNSSESEQSWHEVEETDYDAAPKGWSQVDDDGPPLHLMLESGQETSTASAGTAPTAPETPINTVMQYAEEDYDAAPMSWSQVDDDGPPPELVFRSTDASHDLTGSISRVMRFDGHSSTTVQKSTRYDTAPANWSQVDDDGPPPGLVFRSADAVREQTDRTSRVVRSDAHETSTAYDSAPVNWSQVDDNGPPPELLLRVAEQESTQRGSATNSRVYAGEEPLAASNEDTPPTQPIAQSPRATTSPRELPALTEEHERGNVESEPDSGVIPAQEDETSTPSTPSKPTRALRPTSQGDNSSTAKSSAGSPSSSKRPTRSKKEHKEGFFRKLSTRLKK